MQSVQLANPRGFCAGVDRAIEIVNSILRQHPPPIYVKHEIVHNTTIVNDFKQKGVIFIEDPNEVPQGGILVFSAHGVSKRIREVAAARRLAVFDATCPLVTKVHAEVNRLRQSGCEVIMIGHRNHPEVEGTLGQSAAGMHLVEDAADIAALRVADPDKLAYVTQTTLSVDDTRALVAALRAKFPNIRAPAKDDICYATQNRQNAVKTLAQNCDIILVVGSPTSSNSNRLCEVARKAGVPAHLVDNSADIDARWFADKKRIGISAGASAPEYLVREIIADIRAAHPAAVVAEADGLEEKIVFSAPKSLRNNRAAAASR